MENRKKINDRLISWIRNKVSADYAQDICLVCIYGSHINGTMNESSDVDCYFVPGTDRGYELARTFLLEGVGYDIYPMTWQRLEDIAALKTGMQTLVGDVEIIFCRDDESGNRFRALQEMLKENLNDRCLLRNAAAARCLEAGGLCRAMTAERNSAWILKTAGQIIMTLAEAVVLYHQDYFHFGLKKQYEDLLRLELPKAIPECYLGTIRARDVDTVISFASRMYREVCAYLGISCCCPDYREDPPLPGQVDAGSLAGLYQEICSTFQKIYRYCQLGDSVPAYLSAVCLQRDLDDAAVLGCPSYPLLESFLYGSLSDFARETRKTEENLVRFILKNGGHILSYGTIEEFLEENS